MGNIGHKLKKVAGFTMIELLIVIAVLGVLATAVLSAINPIEQINRGRDTGSRSDAEQLINGIERYYTTQNYYPWMTASGVPVAVTPMVSITTATQLINAVEFLTNLTSGGSQELKSSFVTRIVSSNARKLSLYFSGTDGDAVYSCFIPQSGAFREQAWNRCKETLPADYPPTACPVALCTDSAILSAAGATGCYACLP